MNTKSRVQPIRHWTVGRPLSTRNLYHWRSNAVDLARHIKVRFYWSKQI